MTNPLFLRPIPLFGQEFGNGSKKETEFSTAETRFPLHPIPPLKIECLFLTTQFPLRYLIPASSSPASKMGRTLAWLVVSV
jgi:hypothetical protein